MAEISWEAKMNRHQGEIYTQYDTGEGREAYWEVGMLGQRRENPGWEDYIVH